MERNTPVRKPHTSTADLLTWSENPPADPSTDASASGSRPTVRSHQPSDGISKVLFGGQVTEEEAENLNKRKPCSGPKLKEMTGSGIFAADGENGATESSSTTATPNKTGLRIYQQAVSGMSQISFGADGSVSPKKPTSLTEVAKQRELSGTLESETDDAKMKKQLSDAKSKELSGHDIFAPPPEITPRSLTKHSDLKDSKDSGEAARRNPPVFESNITFSEETSETVVKTAKKIYNQKFAELTGNDIFKGDAPPATAEKPLSSAKLKEMSGSDIFADGKQTSRDYFGGVRKPPGGESSIALV